MASSPPQKSDGAARFVRDMFLVPNPSKHWLAERIVTATESRPSTTDAQGSAEEPRRGFWSLFGS